MRYLSPLRVQANIRQFSERYPEIWNWIESSKGNFDFAASMYHTVSSYGGLTANQEAACLRGIARQKEWAAQKAAAPKTEPVSAEKIEQALKTAKSRGLKCPRLIIGNFVFSLAPEHGKNPGAIYVKDCGEYAGKIINGVLSAARECRAERVAEIAKAAAAPAEAAVAHGKLTGCCACCGRELTDPKSVERGIGPICAANFGWQALAA